MEQSMELVARNCGNQLNEYQRCVLANRSDHDGGAAACQSQRTALSACASDAVPLVSEVKRRCQDQIQVYNSCLQQGQHDTDDQIAQRCTPALRDLWTCTEAVKQEAAKRH